MSSQKLSFKTEHILFPVRNLSMMQEKKLGTVLIFCFLKTLSEQTCLYTCIRKKALSRTVDLDMTLDIGYSYSSSTLML